MLLNLTELVTVDGKEMDYQVPLDMTEFVCRAGKYPVKTSEAVRIHAVHEKKRKIHLTVQYDLVLVIPCDRCLDDVDVKIADTFDVDADLSATAEERAEALDEQIYITGNELDVDCLIQGEVLMNLPDKVLCSQECKGICRVCGTNLNRNTCSHVGEESVDLRTSKFQEFFKANNIKEV